MLRLNKCLLLIGWLFGGVTSQHDPNQAIGRHAMVHLFEWKWNDIAKECERFLGPMGYAGVQVSPPNEHRIITHPFRPWFERYQPVSYKLISRSGNEQEFKDMVKKCNDAGVRIYVDAVINHMAGDAGTGTGGSYYNSGKEEYPAVPFSKWDFNPPSKCPSHSNSIENYGDKYQVRNCRLLGMPDLNQEKDHVQQKIAEYLNNLIKIGVAGFRIDASKHLWPGDIKSIYNRLDNLNTDYFKPNTRPFMFQEVIDLGGEPITAKEYIGVGRVTEFKYGKMLSEVVRKWNNQKMKHLSNWGEGWGMLNTNDAVIFIDNHDNQRGHGAGGTVILTFRDSRLYKIANAFMLAHPYGYIKIMSSYKWDRNMQNGKDQNDWIGPPAEKNGQTKDVIVNSDDTCSNGWICEHRWRQIFNMLRFRNACFSEPLLNWWDNGNNQIAFSRGKKGFLAINNEDLKMNQRLFTGLPDGTYCDIISGNKKDGKCTGHQINVSSGYAEVKIDNSWEDPMIAIYVEAKL